MFLTISFYAVEVLTKFLEHPHNHCFEFFIYRFLVSILFSSFSEVMICYFIWAMFLCLLILAGPLCQGALIQPPGPPWMKKKTTKTCSAWGGKVAASLKGEKGPEPLSPGAFIRFIRIGIQIKLMNHCQPVRVKQYMIYREL